MAEEKDWMDDHCCAECGDPNYQPSKVPGLCAHCCPIGIKDKGDSNGKKVFK